MKKIFYLASIAALALSSCAKDETTQAVIDNVGGGSKIMAKAEGDATRTHLEEVDGKYEFRWSENDVLGVYGSKATSAKNVPFSLLDGYSDQAEGIFESNVKLLAGDNFFAYYPQVPNNDYVPEWVAATKTTAAYWNLAKFPIKIGKNQNYKPSSFNTVTAPAVSDNFVVDEDGNADVTMQPVADYLFVNLAGVEDIQTVTLEMFAAKRRDDKVEKVGVWKYIGSDKDFAAIYETQSSWFNDKPEYSPYEFYWTGYGYNRKPMTNVQDWKYEIVEKRTPQYDNPEPVAIAGEGKLVPYTYIDAEKNKSTRYFLSNEDMISNEITIAAGQLTDVVCHEPNTYVFVVPGGLLGMNPVATGASNKELVAKVTVNKGATNAQEFEFGGNSINGGYALKADGSKDTTKPMWRQWDDAKKEATWKMENTVFWANPSIKGARQTAMYNPKNTFIIKNEVDFLKYMNEYEDNTQLNKDKAAINASNLSDAAKSAAIAAAEAASPYGHDAYICSEYEFDFSEAKMGKYATQINAEYLRKYVTDYLANGMPCIENYKNNFYGNGANLKAITKLQSWFGLFGDIEGTINELTIEDIEAANSPLEELLDTRATDEYDMFMFYLATVLDDGIILGSVEKDNAKANNINKVTIKNANGGAAFGDATVAAFNGVTFDGVAGLDFIAFDLIHNADLDMTKTWDSVKGVDQNVFGMVKAEKATVKTATGSVEDGHHVITIAKGGAAEYEQLAAIIYVAGASDDMLEELLDELGDEDLDDEDFDLDEFIEALLDDEQDPLLDEAVWVDDKLATSVVIENVSFWTGDYIAPVANAAVKTHTQFDIAYAEQLAVGLKDEADDFESDDATVKEGNVFVLLRDIDLNFDNNNTLWEMAELDTNDFATLNGNKKTITGFVMESYNDDAVAPFANAYEIKDLTVNGVEIIVETEDKEQVAVPSQIAGLVGYTEKGLTNVTVNDIVFDAYDISGGFNSMNDPYYGEVQPFIGWVAANSTNAQYNNVKANVTSSNIMGVSGLVAVIDLEDVTESHFEGCSLNATDIAQEELDDFEAVDFEDGYFIDEDGEEVLYNAAGSMVGFVVNGDNVARSIEFNNSGAPVFLYDAGDTDDNCKIVVLYNDTKVAVLEGFEE